MGLYTEIADVMTVADNTRSLFIFNSKITFGACCLPNVDF